MISDANDILRRFVSGTRPGQRRFKVKVDPRLGSRRRRQPNMSSAAVRHQGETLFSTDAGRIDMIGGVVDGIRHGPWTISYRAITVQTGFLQQ